MARSVREPLSLDRRPLMLLTTQFGAPRRAVRAPGRSACNTSGSRRWNSNLLYSRLYRRQAMGRRSTTEPPGRVGREGRENTSRLFFPTRAYARGRPS